MLHLRRPRLSLAALSLTAILAAGCTLPPLPPMPEISMPNVQMPRVEMPNVRMPDLSNVDLSAVAAYLPNVEKGADGGVDVRVRSAPLRIALAATSAALTVASDAYLGLEMDPVELLDQVAGVNVVDLPRTVTAAEAASAEQVATTADDTSASADMAGERVASLPAERGLPPTDVPVLMVISKQNNDMLFWQLSEEVQTVRLRADNPGGIEMKVSNESPLRIELWVDAGIETVDVTVEFSQ
jgi:hypothetical protein